MMKPNPHLGATIEKYQPKDSGDWAGLHVVANDMLVEVGPLGAKISRPISFNYFFNGIPITEREAIELSKPPPSSLSVPANPHRETGPAQS